MTEKRTFRQITSYLLVGGGTALLEVIIFQSLFLLTPMGVAPANIIAVIVATACNFALNGTITFRQSSNLLRSALLYLLLFCVNTAFSTSVINLAVASSVPSLFAKLFTMGCIVIWNYVLYKKVVFR